MSPIGLNHLINIHDQQNLLNKITQEKNEMSDLKIV